MNPDTITTLLYAAISAVQDGKAAEVEVRHEYENEEAETIESITVSARSEVKEYGPAVVYGERIDEEG